MGTTNGEAGKMQTTTQHMTLCANWIWSIFTGKTWLFFACGSATKKGDGLKNPTYTFVVTHGAGGGGSTGSAVNRGEKFGYVIDGMDCLVLGHTHKAYTTQPSKISIDLQNNKVSLKPFKVVSMTSWLAYGGYAARAMLTPSSYVSQEILLRGNRKEIKVIM